MAIERKIYSAVAEKRALRTICEGGRFGAELAAGVTEDHFVSEVGLTAYKRYKFMLSKRDITMSWSDLIEDPGLPKNIQSALAKFSGGPCKDKSETKNLLDTLNRYRKLRGLKKMAENLYKKLSDDTFDPDDIITDTSNDISKIRIGEGGMKVGVIGKGGNLLSVVKRLLNGEEHRYIPTGFQTFDSRNRGFARGSLVMICSTTGGGKSIMCGKLGRNMALNGAKVGLAPLEMVQAEMLQRALSEEANVSMEKMLDPKKRLNIRERNAVIRKFKQLNLRVKRAGGALEFLEPEEDIDIETLLMYAKARGSDVVIVDYIGLLAGADGDDQPKALSRIGRYAKRWATINDKIVIMAAQLSEEGVVRYSRALREHGTNMWSWVYSSFARENKIITITQDKARNQAPFDFSLYMDPSTMTMRDLTDAELRKLKREDSDEDDEDEEKPASTGGKKFTGKKKKLMKKSRDYFEGL